jgi:hypothetical protein
VRRILTAIALLAGSAQAAHADSDGYFCIGPNYLAVQLRSFNTPGLRGPHVLKIVHFDTAGGPRWAGEIVLEDFQPHGMTCTANGVAIAGWADDYAIALDAGLTPRLVSRRKRDARPKAPPMVNLGNWAQQGITPIAVNGGVPRFQLRIVRASRGVKGGVDHHTTSTLEQVGSSGKAIRSLLLHDGHFFEPVH